MDHAERTLMLRTSRLAVALVAIVSLVLGEPAHAAPVRSGTIVGGIHPLAAYYQAPPPHCATAPDCLVWLASGCNPALAGVDPAAWSSIVDVRDLAGSATEHTFRLRTEPPAVFSGEVTVQFWRRDCVQISRFDSTSQLKVRVPADAAWMTVASGPGWLMTGATFTWTLS